MRPACSLKAPYRQWSVLYYFSPLFLRIREKRENVTHTYKNFPRPKGVHAYRAVCAQKTPYSPFSSNDAKKQSLRRSLARPVSSPLLPPADERDKGLDPSLADAAFFRQASRLSADFYDVFREALVRCDELYREHRSLLRRHFPRAEQDHDVAELLRNFEGSGLSMIETADDAFNAALRQMRSAERVYRLAVRDRA